MVLQLKVYSNVPSKIEENLRLDGYVAQIIFNDAKKANNKL